MVIDRTRLVRHWAIVVAWCALASGCSVANLFNNEPFVDAKRDAQGNVVLLDTPRMWEMFTESVDLNIGHELRGSRPPGGLASWNAHWVDYIATLCDGSGQQNPSRYLKYIIETRRTAGLPELVRDTGVPTILDTSSEGTISGGLGTVGTEGYSDQACYELIMRRPS